MYDEMFGEVEENLKKHLNYGSPGIRTQDQSFKSRVLYR